MGPKRDGHWREQGIVEKFPSGGPKVKWRQKVSLGYAGPAVANGRVFLFDYERSGGEVDNNPGKRVELQGKERLLCFDAASGKPLWKYEYDQPYSISYPSGPRCTPTVAEGKVYALGAEGNLTCLDAAKGDVLWKKDLQAEYKTKAPIWGFCAHPLVDGKKLICVVGGTGSVAVAFNKDTGEELWRALSASEQGYCPPTIIEHGGVRQLMIWDADKLSSLDPETGNVYWSQPLKPSYGMAIMAPQISGDYLFASAIGNVAALYKLSSEKPAAEVVWTGKPKLGVYAANSTPLIDGKTLYGVDCDQGMLMAVDLETGKRLWETGAPSSGQTRRTGHGTAFLVKQADRYFIFGETGDLVIAELSPKQYKEIDRAHLLAPTGEAFGRKVVWSHPAFANRCCFARNDEEIVCVDLAAE
jgi:outer membrane protein assembly factor BamB